MLELEGQRLTFLVDLRKPLIQAVARPGLKEGCSSGFLPEQEPLGIEGRLWRNEVSRLNQFDHIPLKASVDPGRTPSSYEFDQIAPT